MATLRSGSYGNYYGSLMTESEPLTATEMSVNATYISSYLSAKGWTKNAIAGLLGNMQAESSLNPGRWQSENIAYMYGGYGLVQWTPATKYIEWCWGKGYIDYSQMDYNLERIVYEVENNLQWIATSHYPMSFKEFTTSNMSCGELAKAFLLNYERPADQSESVQQYRASLAEAWLTGVGGSVTPGTPTPNTKAKRKYNFLLFNARKRKQEWIK